MGNFDSLPEVSKSLHAIRLFYAAYFAAMGLILPYFPIYLSSLGLNATMVGFMLGLLSLAKLIAPPVAGHWLDQKQLRTGLFILITSVLGACSLVAMDMLSGFIVWLALAIFCFGLAYAAILPLTDSLSVHLSEQKISDYGKLRVWGSVGFILTSYLGGWLISPEQINGFVYGLIGLMLVMGIAGLAYPPRPLHHERPRMHFGRNFILLLVLAFLMQASHGAYYGFFSLYLLDVGYSGWQIGAFWVLGVLAEVVLMWRFSAVVQALPFKRLMVACLLLTALRWFGIGLNESVMILLLVQLLHAVSFAAFHLTAVRHVGLWSPPGRQASAQGWYSAIGFGLGSTIGIMACGIVVESVGFSAAFALCAVIVLLGLIPLSGVSLRQS